jgi:Arc/MetJ-type ribon-helix-helix transcriptional regulator
MPKSISVIHKKRERGRPATGHDPARSVRLSDEIIERIEKWAARQGDKPERSEAIRRLLERGLAAEGDASKRTRGK